MTQAPGTDFKSAFNAAHEAGKAHMQRQGRAKFNADDWHVAEREFIKVYVPTTEFMASLMEPFTA